VAAGYVMIFHFFFSVFLVAFKQIKEANPLSLVAAKQTFSRNVSIIKQIYQYKIAAAEISKLARLLSSKLESRRALKNVLIQNFVETGKGAVDMKRARRVSLEKNERRRANKKQGVGIELVVS
jgi:hypothetical protein